MEIGSSVLSALLKLWVSTRRRRDGERLLYYYTMCFIRSLYVVFEHLDMRYGRKCSRRQYEYGSCRRDGKIKWNGHIRRGRHYIIIVRNKMLSGTVIIVFPMHVAERNVLNSGPRTVFRKRDGVLTILKILPCQSSRDEFIFAD